MLRSGRYMFLVLIMSTSSLFGQLSVSNQGVLISLKDGAFVSIHGDYLSELNGSFDNEDTVFLFGDWINNAGNTGFNEPHEGAVVLIGDTQRVRGMDITHYSNLDLRGTGVKFGDLDVIVEDTLQLNDREFNMDTNVVEVTNADTGAVRNKDNTGGFVSSLEDGGLARHTDVAQKYFFPVGSSLGTLRYRPVDITPSTANPHQYKVRMANIDATLEGYDRSVREPIICEINYYYHRIFRLAGNDPADIKMYYDEAQDGTYKNMAHWQGIPEWMDMGQVTYSSGGGGGFSTVEATNWNNFNYHPFALANTSQKFDLNNDNDLICNGDTIVINANGNFISYEFFVNGVPVQDSASNILIISTLGNGDTITAVAQDSTCIAYSNPLSLNVRDNPIADAGGDTTVFPGANVPLHGDGGLDYAWSPDSSLDFPNIPDPIATVYETTPYTLVVTNVYGCKDADTVVVYVDDELNPKDVLFIPNTITPNGDGVNEVWNIRNIDLFRDNEVIILNRWGDVMYSASPYVDSWDGTYNGNRVPDGTYYYIIKLKSIQKTLNGPLTVVR